MSTEVIHIWSLARLVHTLLLTGLLAMQALWTASKMPNCGKSALGLFEASAS
jgi:hypothetical protein